MWANKSLKSMSATGVKKIDEQATDTHCKAVLKSLAGEDTVTLTSGEKNKWIISRTLLRQESAWFYEEFRDLDVTEADIYVSRCRIEPFLQWLYTGHYDEEEHGCKYHTKCAWSSTLVTTAFKIADPWDPWNCQPVKSDAEDVLPWRAKAAIIAWTTGDLLGSPRFQNYAMSRLFHVYSEHPITAPISPQVFEMVSEKPWHAKLRYFYADIIIRNWGDVSIIDHTDKDWSDIFEKYRNLRELFLQAVATPLTKRQAQPLDLENYLLKEWTCFADPKVLLGTPRGGSHCSVPKVLRTGFRTWGKDNALRNKSMSWGEVEKSPKTTTSRQDASKSRSSLAPWGGNAKAGYDTALWNSRDSSKGNGADSETDKAWGSETNLP